MPCSIWLQAQVENKANIKHPVHKPISRLPHSVSAARPRNLFVVCASQQSARDVMEICTVHCWLARHTSQGCTLLYGLSVSQQLRLSHVRLRHPVHIYATMNTSSRTALHLGAVNGPKTCKLCETEASGFIFMQSMAHSTLPQRLPWLQGLSTALATPPMAQTPPPSWTASFSSPTAGSMPLQPTLALIHQVHLLLMSLFACLLLVDTEQLN